MKILIRLQTTLLCVFLAPNLWAETSFDSNHGFLAHAEIVNGRVLTSDASEEAIERAIHLQFRYLLGYLDNGFDITPQAERYETFDVITQPDSNNPELFLTTFRARTEIVIPNNMRASGEVSGVVPLRADWIGNRNFESNYNLNCNSDRSYPLWYGYDPFRRTCQLGARNTPSDAWRLITRYEKDERNTMNKSPEYDRLWNDGVMRILAVMGNHNSFAPSDFAENAISGVSRIYGSPTARSKTGYSSWNDHFVNFNTRRGPLEIRILDLWGTNFQSRDADFVRLFKEYSAHADLISYAGHAGLGRNIDALMDLTQFTAGHYQVFHLEACHPWAYLRESFFTRISQSNGGEPWSRYVDVISATGNSGLSTGTTLISLVQSMVLSERNYRGIISASRSMSRGVVIGEEDNP